MERRGGDALQRWVQGSNGKMGGGGGGGAGGVVEEVPTYGVGWWGSRGLSD